MHIVILGANGQLGSDLVNLLQRKSMSYTAVTENDFNALNDDVSEKILSATHVINCIALTNVDYCESNSEIAFKLNTNFSYKLAKICKNKGIILLHISTDYVFDGHKIGGYTETDIPNPLNIYGLSKLAGDLAIKNYTSKYFIFRVSSLFGKAGASGKGGNFITAMQNLALKQDSVSVISDQISCPTSTLSVARVIISFVEDNISDYGLYNCVSSNSCSWYEFAYEIFRLSALDLNKLHKADFISYNFVAKRPKISVLSTKKIGQYYKMPTWQDSLNEYFNL